MPKLFRFRTFTAYKLRRLGYFQSHMLAVALLMAQVFLICPAQAVEQPRERKPLNFNWRFTKDDPKDAAEQLAYEKIKDWVTQTGGSFLKQTEEPTRTKAGNKPGENLAYVKNDFDDSAWKQLDLPHDWGIEGFFKQEYPGDTGKLPWWGVGWYRKSFSVPAGEQGQRFFLDIDGAMSYATVWLNGHFVGGWPYGYASFRLDLTPHIKYGGDNVLAIRLDNPPSSSRWYPGGGIYRNVWLVKTSPIHVGQWGTFISTPDVSNNAATVNVKTTVDNQSAADATLKVTTKIYELGKDGKKIGSPVASSTPAETAIPTGKSGYSETIINVVNPKLWNLEKPQLYAALTTIEQNGKLIDSYETVFGIRTIKFDAEKGFFLNGVHVRLNGVCNHHDLGALGTATNTRALQRQIEILKEMGCNAIRTSHNPPAPELLDLCDRMGMVVMDEAFDCWRRGKNINDYQKLYEDWHEKDLRAMLRRDRNHPCVILWSIGNEPQEQWIPDGWKLAAELAQIAREEDSTRPTTAGLNEVQAGYNGFQKALEVFGYNYKPFEYENFHKANAAIPLFGSETASCISSRGEYFFPVSENQDDGRANFQMSSYDLSAVPWGTIPDREFKGQDEFPFVAGEFVWTGFDYLGEPTPYNGDVTNLLNFTNPEAKAKMAKELEELGKIKVPSRSSYFGIVDLCGFKKDLFYIYQARWRPDLPMAHILPHWNWPDRVGQVTPVHVYTTGDEAELFLNGKSQGRKKKEQFQYRIRWDDVKYEPGELKVVAYKDGREWAEAVTSTTGPAAKLTMQADRNQLRSDGADLAFVTVAVADKDGQMAPLSNNRISFEIEGPGEIAAVDNGDATSHESFQSKQHNAYNGLCLVIVRTKAGSPGNIVLTAQSEGLQSTAIRLTSSAEN